LWANHHKPGLRWSGEINEANLGDRVLPEKPPLPTNERSFCSPKNSLRAAKNEASEFTITDICTTMDNVDSDNAEASDENSKQSKAFGEEECIRSGLLRSANSPVVVDIRKEGHTRSEGIQSSNIPELDEVNIGEEGQ